MVYSQCEIERNWEIYVTFCLTSLNMNGTMDTFRNVAFALTVAQCE